MPVYLCRSSIKSPWRPRRAEEVVHFVLELLRDNITQRNLSGYWKKSGRKRAHLFGGDAKPLVGAYRPCMHVDVAAGRHRAFTTFVVSSLFKKKIYV